MAYSEYSTRFPKICLSNQAVQSLDTSLAKVFTAALSEEVSALFFLD